MASNKDRTKQQSQMFSKAASPAGSGEAEAATSTEQRLAEALGKIAKIAGDVAGGMANHVHTHDDEGGASEYLACSGPRSLPARLLIPAANTATKLNPANQPAYWRKSAAQL